MKKSLILNILLSVVLIVLAVVMWQTAAGRKGSPAGNPAMETILTRASVRSYTPEQVAPEQVELLLRAAMAAPSAVNKQPWAFVVVNERETLDSLAASLPYAKMLAGAPLAIVVCGDLTKALLSVEQAYWVQDCSAATQNLLLAAHSLGLGAVWTGVFPREDRAAEVKRILNLPAHLVPLNVIPVGHPEGETKPKDKWEPANVHYNRFQ